MNGSRYTIDGIYAINCGGVGGTPGPCKLAITPIPKTTTDKKTPNKGSGEHTVDSITKTYQNSGNGQRTETEVRAAVDALEGMKKSDLIKIATSTFSTTKGSAKAIKAGIKSSIIGRYMMSQRVKM